MFLHPLPSVLLKQNVSSPKLEKTTTATNNSLKTICPHENNVEIVIVRVVLLCPVNFRAPGRNWNTHINLCSHFPPRLRLSASPQTWTGPWLSPDDIVLTPMLFSPPANRGSFLVSGYSPPLGYRTPPWPSLYWPFDASSNTPQYLYYGIGKSQFSSKPPQSDGRYLEVYIILDICHFWRCIFGRWTMGLERLYL
jgi:hypothetical protein